MPTPPATTKSPSPVFPALALFIAVFVLFSPCIRHGFIDLDDPIYLLGNKHIQHGLNWQTIKWAFTTTTGYYWIPVTWLSFTLDWQIFHTDSRGYYLVNV